MICKHNGRWQTANRLVAQESQQANESAALLEILGGSTKIVLQFCVGQCIT